MIGAVRNRRPIGLEIECFPRIGMPAQRARDRHQAVTVRVAAGRRCLAEAAGDRVAGDTLRQRQRLARVGAVRKGVAPAPVLVAHGTVAQIRDAGAANSGEPGECGGVGTGSEKPIDAMAPALQRCPMVRSADEDERTQR